MDSPNIIHKLSLAVIKDKKILLVRSKGKDVFYNLGGKVEEGESDEDCLVREVKEEINCDIDISSLVYENSFDAPAHGRENTVLHMKLYRGTIIGDPTPSSEIEEIRYFDSTMPDNLKNAMLRLILPYLKEKDYIN